MAKKKLKITLKKSPIGANKKQRGTIRALGFRKVNQTVEWEDSSQVRGMIDRVRHMVTVEE